LRPRSHAHGRCTCRPLAKQLTPIGVNLRLRDFTAQGMNEAILLGANQHEKLSKKMKHWKTSGLSPFW
jgi:hypothetical protein